MNKPLEPEVTPLVIVRIRTNCWYDYRGIVKNKTIAFVKRQSRGHNFLQEDAEMVGADETLARITNFADAKDGLYRVAICNEKRDWESGLIDDYDYRLVPFVEPKETACQPPEKRG